MKPEEEVRRMLLWLEDEEAAEPSSWPEPGYIYDNREAIDVLRWVLEQ